MVVKASKSPALYQIGLPTFSRHLGVGLSMRFSSSEPPAVQLVVAVVALVACWSQAPAAAPLYDPVVLNIGVNCQWQPRCERDQRGAMKDAHRFIARDHPPLWRIQLCNKNARRATARVDWIGFNNCIRNYSLGPLAQRRR